MTQKLFKFFLIACGFYFIASLVFASSWVQQRILKEVEAVTRPLGVELHIDNIDVSLLMPRIYLNRVSLNTNQDAELQISKPLSIERIKIALNPIALLTGKLSLSEVAFYQPKIIFENADVLYKKLEKLLEKKSKWKVQGSQFNIEVEKIGIVDAYVYVTLQDSRVGIDSGRFTLFVTQSVKDQYSISSNFTDLTLTRGDFHNVIKAADFDLDITPKSIRANSVAIESDWLSLNIKGATSLPFSMEEGPQSFRASYEIKASLEVLAGIQELKSKLPKQVSGVVGCSGSLEKKGKSYFGAGKFFTNKGVWDGIDIGNAGFSFSADGKKAVFENLLVEIESGKVESKKIELEFTETYPFKGEISLSKVEVNHLLKKLKVKKNPLFVEVDGEIKASGKMLPKFSVEGQIQSQIRNLIVVAHVDQALIASNKVISIASGSVNGSFKNDPEEGFSKAQIKLLDGVLVADARWSKNSPLQINVEGRSLSLTQLKNIQELPFGGVANIHSTIHFEQGDPVIDGDFLLENGEISNVLLGAVKGRVQYQNDLLTFESLELSSLDKIRADGFVDFKPKETRYRFNVASKRASIDQVFGFFKKMELSFSPPQGGELSANVVLEGGHDDKGIQVSAQGKVRGINWFKESWVGGTFSLVYRSDYVHITRATLTKARGALGFNGFFQGAKSKLQLQSYGLKLEDLNHVGGAPLSGEIVGKITLEGDLEHPTGEGEIQLIKTFFRNQSLGDSNVSLRESPQRTEFVGNLFGSSLQGRWIISREKANATSEILLNLRNCNVTPLMTMWISKDLPSFGSVKATGDVQLSGDFKQWSTVSGSGTLSDLQLDLKNAPVSNQKPVSFAIQGGAVKVAAFELSGQDSLISGNLDFTPNGKISAAIDAKTDLLYLQPFIPGLEYATGKVTVGLRFSGRLPKFDLLGNILLQDGTFRIENVAEDFRNARGQFSVTQDMITVDRFETGHGGGIVQVKGGVGIERFSRFSPSLTLVTKGVGFRQQNYLQLKVSGELALEGEQMPYKLSGKCMVEEGRLSSLNINTGQTAFGPATLRFDLDCKANKGFIVDTDVMQAEWRGEFKVIGDNNNIGLLGAAESARGVVFFKDTKFNLVSGNIKFDDPQKINPRFNVTAKSFVKEQRTQVPIEYEVTLSAYGTAQDYKIRLSSVPSLPEPDLIALLVLGVTTRGQDDNYLDFGSTLVGKSPLQSKLQNEFGVDIKVNLQRSGVGAGQATQNNSGSTPGAGGANSVDTSVPAVKIQKDITNKTKVSYSSTLDQNALKEFKIEQLLDENFTINASAVDKFRGSTQNDAIKSYGLDVRYRFQFE